MSLDFDTSDRVDSGNFNAGTQQSWFVWAYPRTLGGGSIGRYFAHLEGTLTFIRLLLHGEATSKLRLQANWSGGTASWVTSDVLTFNAWQSIAVVYDFGNTANDPTIYLNGSSVSLTESFAPSGTPAADGGFLRVGNNLGFTEGFDGLLADLARWPRLLSARDVLECHLRGPRALPYPTDLWWRFPDSVASAYDFSGTGRDGTITGAVVGADHPWLVGPGSAIIL